MSSSILANNVYENGFNEDDNFKKPKSQEIEEEIIDAEIITVSKAKYETLGKAFTELIREVSDDELTDKFVAFMKAGRDLGMELGDRGLARDLQIGGAFELAGETVGLVKDIANIFIGDKAPDEKRESGFTTIILDENKNAFNGLQLENKNSDTKELPFNGGEDGKILQNTSPIKPTPSPNNEVKALQSPKPFVLTGKYSGRTKELNSKER